MAVMQAQINISVFSDTVVLHISRKCIGLVGHYGPIGTGRERLDGNSTPIGGAKGIATNTRIMRPTQIVPCLTQVFGGVFCHFSESRAMICPQAKDPLSLDVNAHMNE